MSGYKILVAGLTLLLAQITGAHTLSAEVELNPRRLAQWVARGADWDIVYATYHRIERFGDNGPGSWIYEWSKSAEFYAALGKKRETANKFGQAREAYLSASLLYSVAKFSTNATPAQRAAYAKHLEYYIRAGKYFDVPLQVVEVPYRGGNIVGYLHMPKNATTPPLVIWTNGIDTHKADAYQRIQPFLERGMAVLAFDSPGTGEGAEWPATPESGAMYTAVYEYMTRDKRIDASRIGLLGISFGGHYAARMAATEPRFKAVVAMCAPVHEFFVAGAEALAAGSRETLDALAQALGITHGDFEAIARASAPFSLYDAGLIGKGETIAMPLLVVNGNQDPLVPLWDMEILAA
ncbi:MAG: alpha/beta fold hydrolase, partial [Proteobacteria bacterium]|nr:alpha/beta fold hydrolase [Pseudomonadota bacterium]